VSARQLAGAADYDLMLPAGGFAAPVIYLDSRPPAAPAGPWSLSTATGRPSPGRQIID
jgi:hypothetical protein